MLQPAPAYDALHRALSEVLPATRLITDPLRRLAWGTDASFYRLVPKIVAVVDSEAELIALLAHCRAFHAPVTFRAAGTSLSGQAISDSVLVVLGDGWRGAQIGENAETITLQPGVIGAAANRLLAPYGRKIGPDPASIDAARIGGIAANNASGMCCGTRQNSYHTLAAMRVVLTDGTVLDTADPASVGAFRLHRAPLLLGLAQLARRAQREPLASRIRHKYRIKNTTGYGLNALLDFADPIEMLTHLMIGSEGTLGFISSITLRTVPDAAHKATALVLFDSLRVACATVARIKPLAVDAVELMDRAALAAVADQPGMPEGLAHLGADGAGLLIETRAEDEAALARQVAALEAMLHASLPASPVVFTTDPAQMALLWKVRKGTFTSVGATRRIGTTVVIEDVAFPIERLADATLDLQAALRRRGYDEAIIFGHALEGNLHFCFTQDFSTEIEVRRYAELMNDVVRLVVDKYDGALKAEHGTGRNMAPFVAREWGAEAHALMVQIKRLFDPENLLNPGVILNDAPDAHLQHLKALPVADAIVDKCIECGFCEPTCPSAGFTFTPRQRITTYREIQRRRRAGEEADELAAAFKTAAVDTCAGCGLCALACPVKIETGALVKAQRRAAASPFAQRIGTLVAEHYGATTHAVGLGLAAADLLHATIGTRAMTALTGTARALSGDRIPLWQPQMPRSTGRLRLRNGDAGEPLVYFPSCAARAMGAARGDDSEPLPTVTARLLARAGFAPRYAQDMASLCCGQPFESKGLMTLADDKSAELEDALRAASDNGRLPIVFDTSPCAWRMKRFLAGRLNILDIVEALDTLVLPRLALAPVSGPIAVHPVCSLRKQGLDGTLLKVARACAPQAFVPDGIGCCGWAGDKGFTLPDLNAHALRDLKAALPPDCAGGVSSSRTCEIGLSAHGGIGYRSIVYLVEQAAAAGTALSETNGLAAAAVAHD